MSRVGKHPVSLASGVQASIVDGVLSVKGKLGGLSLSLNDAVQVLATDQAVEVTPTDDSKKSRMMWGTIRNVVQNMVTGVSVGFKRELEINGVGYRAALQGKDLVLSLGYSHEVRFAIPEGISITVEKPTSIVIQGISKEAVGQVASQIRAYRPPEPYKGKGIKYVEEFIVRKEGKKK